MAEEGAARQTPASPAWRPKVALFLFGLALASPLLVPLVLATDLPRETRASLAGLLLFGVPMALMLTVVALVGRPAFLFLESGVAKRVIPLRVSVIRYRIGLVLLTIPVIVSWLEPLAAAHVPVLETRRVLIGAVADGMVLISLFVLGGEFWAKVHALFVHDARVVADVPAAGGVAAIPEAVPMRRRFYLGVAILAGSFATWLLVPIAAAAEWSTAQIASLSGGILVANKVLLFTAIAIMGKTGFNHLKRLLFGLLRRLGPPQQVGRRRYRLGLILLMVPMLMTWVAPYAPAILGQASVYRFLQDRSLELLLLMALFLLGGDFWDKMRALFKHRAKVEIAAATAAASAD